MRAVFLALAVLFATTAHAANYPCSGKKGGVERCVGERFLCRDGQYCTGPRGGTFCYTDSGKKSYPRK